jgi:hypothetical protein
VNNADLRDGGCDGGMTGCELDNQDLILWGGYISFSLFVFRIVPVASAFQCSR